MMRKVKCPICETEIEIENFFDVCPYCDFECVGIDYTGIEDEKDTPNTPSYREAKELFARGLNFFGEPLPKRD